MKSFDTEIERIKRLRSATRLWRFRNKDNKVYRDKKRLEDQIYHAKTLHN